MNIISRDNGYFVLDGYGNRISPALESNAAAAEFAKYVQDYGLPSNKSEGDLLDWFYKLRGIKRNGKQQPPSLNRSNQTTDPSNGEGGPGKLTPGIPSSTNIQSDTFFA